MLSDLNKHMRTVHQTYRRKAKISKDQIMELDNPETEIQPKIYGAKLEKPVPKHEKPVPAKNVVKSGILQKVQIGAKIETATKSGTVTLSPKIAAAVTSSSFVTKPTLPTKPTVMDSNKDDIAQSIKEELGLSSVITLEKIQRKVTPPPLPKLTYHGPRLGPGPPAVPNQTQTFGSISLTPLSSLKREGPARRGVKGPPQVGIDPLQDIPALLPIKTGKYSF